MRITIDNGDGHGAVDYTGMVASDGPVIVQRGLNVPSRCTADLLCGPGGLPAPARLGRVVVQNDAGAVLFTGYLATEPVQEYAGTATTGAVYRARLSAISDEWLLDRAGSGVNSSGGVAFHTDAVTAMAQLTGRVLDGGSAFMLESTGAPPRALGALLLQPSRPWSVNASAVAGAAYASYRGVNGQVLFSSAATAMHALSDADGTLQAAELQLGAARELANDVTISGDEEPTAYLSESFQGDGTTAEFVLSEAVFRATLRTPIDDSFAGAAIDSAVWQVSDPAGALSLTGAGLAVAGGTGVDGKTFLRGIDLVEMGGSVVAQLGSVVLGGASPGGASNGMLAGFYAGTPVLANCVAGFRVRQSADVTVLVPVVNSVETGTVFTPTSGHRYTLRVRMHCVEMLRVGQPYYCMVDGVVEAFGSASGIDAPLDFVFEVLDEGVSSNTPATVLYDSAAAGAALTGLAGACSFVPLNAETMTASVGSVSVLRPGSLQVVSTLPDGTRQTRLLGSAGQGVDCEATYRSTAGTAVTFFAGRIPVAGERVTAIYRSSRRAVARLADAASIAAEGRGGASGFAGVSRWIGKVVQPPARTSVDCESAAQALLAFATSRSAALKGSYTLVNPTADVWPGDLLQVTSGSATTPLLVRSVVIEDGHAVPEVLRYKAGFANDWATELADGLGLRLSDRIASDAVLPASAENGPGEVLANLPQLALTSVSTTTLQVDAGCDPPSGGGFEVRRRDWSFGVGVDPVDLVLRSPVRSFSIPRAAQSERYYVRMYDTNSPVRYSRFSSAVFVHAPVG